MRDDELAHRVAVRLTVALLAKLRARHAIATVRREGAGERADTRPVGGRRGDVARPVVALFRAVLDPVAAIAGKRAVRVARAVGAGVLAVIALLAWVFDA